MRRSNRTCKNGLFKQTAIGETTIFGNHLTIGEENISNHSNPLLRTTTTKVNVKTIEVVDFT